MFRNGNSIISDTQQSKVCGNWEEDFKTNSAKACKYWGIGFGTRSRSRPSLGGEEKERGNDHHYHDKEVKKTATMKTT